MLVQVFNSSVLDNVLAKGALSPISIGFLVALLQLGEVLPDEARGRSAFVLCRD